jgi:hypothetical protein
MKRKAKKKKPFLSLSASKREQVVRAFDAGVSFDETRPLSEKGKLLWNRAKRGRPKIGKGAQRVLITIEGGLLQDTDRAARRSGKNRSQFIADALHTALRRRAS